jgi:hypothetical protein
MSIDRRDVELTARAVKRLSALFEAYKTATVQQANF